MDEGARSRRTPWRASGYCMPGRLRFQPPRSFWRSLILLHRDESLNPSAVSPPTTPWSRSGTPFRSPWSSPRSSRCMSRRDERQGRRGSPRRGGIPWALPCLVDTTVTLRGRLRRRVRHSGRSSQPGPPGWCCARATDDSRRPSDFCKRRCVISRPPTGSGSGSNFTMAAKKHWLNSPGSGVRSSGDEDRVGGA